MRLVGADGIAIAQAVGTHHRPLHGRVALADGGAQVVRGLLVVGMRRHQRAHQADHAALGQRQRLAQVAVAVAGGVHQHEADRLRRPVGRDGAAQAAHGVGHQAARRAVDALERRGVAQARRHRRAVCRMARQIGVIQVQHAGLNQGQAAVAMMAPQRVGRAHDGPDRLPAVEQLRDQQPSGRAAGADYECPHRRSSFCMNGAIGNRKIVSGTRLADSGKMGRARPWQCPVRSAGQAARHFE
ncbi:Uncharacterised protein [Achromobacter sp. 2789STDY5608621]|nr:Uncharacterised protein [Achromobacter sp. 2789STDY5608621]